MPGWWASPGAAAWEKGRWIGGFGFPEWEVRSSFSLQFYHILIIFISRKQFVASSIEFLFASTYEVATDDMPISSLVSYLNAAMPLDKHEDFDTAEVVKYVAGLKEKGRVVLEGDIVRLVD